MYYFCSFIVAIINAFVCAHFAKKRGRNSQYWFISGAFFGIFATTTLFLLPPKKVDAAPQTSSPPPPLLQAIVPTQATKFWYYLDQEKKQYGPLSFDGLSRAWGNGNLHAHSFVWNEELENWKRFDEVISISNENLQLNK